MKVAIIGTAPSSRGLAPYQDSSWKIWACSQGNQGILPRVDAWFELHAIGDMTGEERRAWSLPFYAWLRTQQFPIYMIEKNDLVPQAIVFPRDAMLKAFGRNWFTSSVAWMLGFAIYQMRAGDEIGLFGIDMAADQELYTAQKAGCLRFIEIAKEKGIIVHIPDESCLGQQPPLYGYSEATRFGRKLNVRLNEMRTLLGRLDSDIARLTNERNYTLGAIHDAEYIMRTFTDGADADLDDGKTVIVGEQPKATEKPVDALPRPEDFAAAPGSQLLMPKARNGSGKHPTAEG